MLRSYLEDVEGKRAEYGVKDDAVVYADGVLRKASITYGDNEAVVRLREALSDATSPQR